MTTTLDYLPMVDGEYADADGEFLTIAEVYEIATEFIDQHWPMTRACGLAFAPSEVLRQCSPSAYRNEVGATLRYMLDRGTLTRATVSKAMSGLWRGKVAMAR